jgi:hypothetical protein
MRGKAWADVSVSVMQIAFNQGISGQQKNGKALYNT